MEPDSRILEGTTAFQFVGLPDLILLLAEEVEH